MNDDGLGAPIEDKKDGDSLFFPKVGALFFNLGPSLRHGKHV
jgi:hypothetical protein